MSKEKDVIVYCTPKGTKTERGEVKKDRIYAVFKNYKPDDHFEYKGKGLYKLTDHIKSLTANDIIKSGMSIVAKKLGRTVENVSNFQVDYISTDPNGDMKFGLAAENELWRNRHKRSSTQEIENDETYWNQNQERGSISKSERSWVDDTSGELGLDPEDWYWNIN